MKMKAIILSVLLVGIAGWSYAQPERKGNKKEHREKVEQMKIAYFTKELDLSTAESEKFWPVYHELEKKRQEVRKSTRETIKKMHEKGDDQSEQDLKKGMYEIFDMEAKEAAINKEGFDKLSGVVGVKKAAKAFKLEKDFKHKLLMELKDKPRHPQPHHRGGPRGGGEPPIGE
ncbi:MAG: hypothetical protein EP338_05560 [Bacteroidetes bacterium]|nr:MAG: hypothetical protein EP338_05560 [Bacteroidota bacterium]